MTVNQLIKKLEKIRSKYGKRVHVVVDVRECRVNPAIFEEYSHWSASGVSFEVLPWAKDDSFELADGTERVRRVVSISL